MNAMDDQNVVSAAGARSGRAAALSRSNRVFYSATAAVLLLLTLAGFQAFYLHGRSYPDRPIPAPIRTLVIVHGAAMTAWVVLFLVQPLLIATRKHRVHMTAGWVGTALALAIVVLGFQLGIEATRIMPPDMIIWNLPPRQFMAVPIVSVTIFACLIAAAVWRRRKPVQHRSLMLLATLTVMSAAVSRIDALNALYLGTVWDRVFGPFFITLVIGGALVIVKCVMDRSLDRWLAVGYVGLVLASAGILQLARTPLWDAFASAIL